MKQFKDETKELEERRRIADDDKWLLSISWKELLDLGFSPCGNFGYRKLSLDIDKQMKMEREMQAKRELEASKPYQMKKEYQDLMAITEDQLRTRNSNGRVEIEVGGLKTNLGDVVLGHLNEFPIMQSVTDRSLSKYQEFWNPKSRVIGKYNQDEVLKALDNLNYEQMGVC